MQTKNSFAFTRINFILLGIAIGVILLGFVLMSGKGSTEDTFNPAIFDARHILVAPMVCLAGYLFMIVAILYRPARKADASPTVEPANPKPEA